MNTDPDNDLISTKPKSGRVKKIVVWFLVFLLSLPFLVVLFEWMNSRLPANF